MSGQATVLKKLNSSAFLGTLAAHLLLAIVFVTYKAGDLDKKFQQRTMIINYAGNEEELDRKMQVAELKKRIMQQQLTAEQLKDEISRLGSAGLKDELKRLATDELQKDLKDIPVNVGGRMGKVNEELNPDKYLKNFKDQIGIKDPEEQSNAATAQRTDAGNIGIQQTKPVANTANEQKEKYYQGPTTISFSLTNRNSRYMHIPVYLCETSGKVVVNIKVDQQGNVVAAVVNVEKSEVNNPCLFDAAVKSAYRSRFTSDFNSPLKQDGSIAYTFRPQR